MSGQHLTQSEYDLQQVVVLFAELLSQLAEAGFTPTFRDVFRFCELASINYLVMMHLNPGTSPFQEWAEEWLHVGEV
jgi:hypothetical protein